MCGIVGIFAEAASEGDLADVEKMLDAISHRGPDDRHIWQGHGVTLGHCRLAILDTSTRAAQPLLTVDGTGVLAYNGEIYNAPSLRDQLIADGCAFEGSGDTEVVLQALHHWGPERAVPLFNGMFALVYLDRRASMVWMARDRLGIKPLAIATRSKRIIAASEIKALNAVPALSCKLRTEMIPRWLAEPRVHAHTMLAKDVEELPPGALWRWNRGDLRKSLYFSIPGAVDTRRIIAASRPPGASLTDQLECLLNDSTVAHMASDAPLATMCSGGVDSSLISAFAARAVPNLTAYVADLAGTGEADAALAVGRHLGLAMRQVSLNRAAFLHLWPHAIHHSDGPIFMPSDVALLAVARAARADGFKVLLTGEGSDELFGGYHWHMITQRRWQRLEGLRGLLYTPRRHARARQRLEQLPFASPWPSAVDQHRVLVAYGGHSAPQQRALLTLLGKVCPPSERALAAACLHDLNAHLRWLLHRHDRMGMAASIEMRVPFLENRLIDFALHLPPGSRIRHRKGKWLVKAVAGKYLPGAIVHARKKGFPVPPAYWKGCESVLVDGHLQRLLGWARAEWEALTEGLMQDSLLAFHLVGLELWLEQRLEGRTPDAQAQRLDAALSTPINAG